MKWKSLSEHWDSKNKKTTSFLLGLCEKPNQKKTKASKIVPKLTTSNICANGDRCPSGTTCCQISSVDALCCWLENAVCCNDQTCCPQGYTCDGTGDVLSMLGIYRCFLYVSYEFKLVNLFYFMASIVKSCSLWERSVYQRKWNSRISRN